MREESLFNKVDWHTQVHAQFEGLAAKVRGFSKQLLESKSDEVLIPELVEEHKLNIPVILDDEISVASSEFTSDHRTGLSITVHVPFTGDRDMFRVQPPTYGGAPRGDVADKFIQFTVLSFNQASPKDEIDRNVAQIKQYLDWQRNGLGDFHERLASAAASALKDRRAALQSNTSLLDNLGYKQR